MRITTLAAALATAFACSAWLPATAAGAAHEYARSPRDAVTAGAAQTARGGERAAHAAGHRRAAHARGDDPGVKAAKEATGREAVAAERAAHMPVAKTDM